MADEYRIVIGLEVHVQLLTNTKLFCGCSTKFGARPNTQVCPICLGLPGSLPVMNRKAFDLAIRAASALHCELATFTKWDRKNYYYPDLPKGYQISQYDLPFAERGYVEITHPSNRKIRLIRVHLEEDAGKNTHSETGGDSLVDLNRTGTPLLEIVSEPDMTSPEEAGCYLETLRQLMRDLEISDCEMQEGSLRCDANVNIHIDRDGKTFKTPITELKNMNSIKMIEKAIAYEAKRQYLQWQEDGKVMGQVPKETRGWDDAAGVSTPQRAKEEAADYRYFPEPDLVPVVINQEWIERACSGGGERADARKTRYQQSLGLSEYNANVIVDQGKATIDYFEALVTHKVEPKSAANWIINDVLAHAGGRLKTIDDIPIKPAALAELIGLVANRKVNLNDAREKILPAMKETGDSASKLMQSLGLEVVEDRGAVEQMVLEVFAEMPSAVVDFRGGKQKALGSLVGAVMKKSKGKFPPALVNEVLTQKLNES